MSRRDYGPGSDPELYSGIDTYCLSPSVTAQFITSETVDGPPMRFYVMLYEIRNMVFGQVLSECCMRQFSELPHIGPEFQNSQKDIEYESGERHDPLPVLWETLEALEMVVDRVCGSDPILNSIEVVDRMYVEVGIGVVHKYGTPFTDFVGLLSEADIATVGHSGSNSTPNSPSL